MSSASLVDPALLWALSNSLPPSPLPAVLPLSLVVGIA